MSDGRKPLTGAQKEAAWKLARKHGLMLLEQGTNAFDAALFLFAAEVADMLIPSVAEIMESRVPALHWVDHAGVQQALSLADFQRIGRRGAEEPVALRRALHEITEEWAGAECGTPVTAQEAYAISLAKRMSDLANEALGRGKPANV